MILTLRRYCMIIFIYFHLLVRKISIKPNSLVYKITFNFQLKKIKVHKILAILLLILIIAYLLTKLFSSLKEKSFSLSRKLSVFECGFNSLQIKKFAFSINFFLLIIIFLVFDIEISFLIPILKTNYSILINKFFSILILILLTIILIKE